MTGPAMPPSAHDYYLTLGLDRSAPPNLLVTELHRRIAQSPPGPGRDYLLQAVAILGDPAKRRIYDDRLYNPQLPPWSPAELHQLALGASTPPGPPTRLGPLEPAGKRRTGRRAIFLGGGALALVLALVIGLTAGGGSSSSANCDDIIFIGAAGSGQRDGAKNAAEDGMGNFVNTTYKNLLADANKVDKTIDVRPVDYPALPVNPLRVAPAEFTESLNRGTTVATTMIKDAVAQCPKSKVVVAGYSQGAMVAHRALLAVKPSQALIGMLIADGDRVLGDPNVRYGGTDKANHGISFTEWGEAISGISSAGLFPAGFQGRILSWCTAGDTVCSNARGKVDSPAGPVIHTTGYSPKDWQPHLAKLALS